MPSTYFLTGATGFVGRSVVPRLRRDGHAVRALVRDATRTPVGTVGVTGDLERTAEWAGALAGCDTVVHLAARVHVMHEGAADPLRRFREVNRDATLGLAEAAAGAGVRRFLFVSSIKVNGEATHGRPFRADDPPAPADPYGISKLEAEEGLRTVAARTGLEVVVIRPPLVHGPGAGGNLRRLLGLIARGIPLPLGAIANRRTMVGVENLSDLIAVAATSPDAAGGTFLAGDSESVSTPELVRLLGAGLGRAPRIFPVPVSLLRLGGALIGRGDDMARLTGSLEVDVSGTRTRLRWSPPRTLVEGLTQMAQAWKNAR
jgi:nucleoside-diphosphate-sugar epimerase